MKDIYQKLFIIAKCNINYPSAESLSSSYCSGPKITELVLIFQHVIFNAK